MSPIPEQTIFERNQDLFIQFTGKVYETFRSEVNWDAVQIFGWVEVGEGAEKRQERYLVPRRGQDEAIFFEIVPMIRFTAWINGVFFEHGW